MAEYRKYGFCGIIEKAYNANQASETINQVLGDCGRKTVRYA